MASSSASQPDEGDPVLFVSNLSTRTYVLNQPQKLNALTEEMIDILRPRIAEWDRSELCKIIVGTGNGRAFCAGGDVRAVVEKASRDSTRPGALQFFQKEFELDFLLASLSKPYVAVLDGITMGGGVGLSVHAPFRVATENTVFAMPETKIGYCPDVGASFFLARLDGQIGTYLALTGSTLKGQAVYEHGLSTHFVPSRRLPSLLDRLSALEDPSPKIIDQTLNEFSSDLGDKWESPLTGATRVALDSCFSHDTVEEIIKSLNSVIEKEGGNPDLVGWAKSTLKELELRSPTSLKVSLEAIRRGKNMTLDEALRMEMRIASAFCSGASPDFQTGVEAVLVQKSADRPGWQPSSLVEVPRDGILRSFFSKDSPFLRSTPPLNLTSPSADPAKDPMHFALPTESEIGEVVRGDHPTSGSFVVTFEEVIGRFEAMKEGKQGVRPKISEVVARRCDVDQLSGALKWKY